ncbi:MAG: hypothetical protein COB92_01960 [Robiginitomaculum sp.]|nr:MAG: hypothetical protein COB92_01960 [Robiginitomaculum sp.]
MTRAYIFYLWWLDCFLAVFHERALDFGAAVFTAILLLDPICRILVSNIAQTLKNVLPVQIYNL